jgi:hypothetical protein
LVCRFVSVGIVRMGWSVHGSFAPATDSGSAPRLILFGHCNAASHVPIATIHRRPPHEWRKIEPCRMAMATVSVGPELQLFDRFG